MRNKNIPTQKIEDIDGRDTMGCGIPTLLGLIAGTLIGALTLHNAGLPYSGQILTEATRNAFISTPVVTGVAYMLLNKFTAKN